MDNGQGPMGDRAMKQHEVKIRAMGVRNKACLLDRLVVILAIMMVRTAVGRSDP